MLYRATTSIAAQQSHAVAKRSAVCFGTISNTGGTTVQGDQEKPSRVVRHLRLAVNGTVGLDKTRKQTTCFLTCLVVFDISGGVLIGVDFFCRLGGHI